MEYTRGEWKYRKGSEHLDIITGDLTTVCYLPNNVPEVEANAQLIASAPELYGALRRIFERADRGLPLDRTIHLIPAGKALAKADGK